MNRLRRRSERSLNPNSWTMKKTCASCSRIVGVSQTPSTCGSFSMKPQASFASQREKTKPAVPRLARSRSARNLRAASLIQRPCFSPASSRAAARAHRSARAA